MAESTNEVTLDNAGRNKISVSRVSSLAPSQVWRAGSGHFGISSRHLRNFRVGTLIVNTLKGRVCEVVETLSRRKVDLCCVQETRYGGGHCSIIRAKTQDTNCSGLETAKVLLVLECLWRRSG